MTQAYIEGGPSSANHLMPDFDKASDELQTEVEQFLSLTDAAVGETEEFYAIRSPSFGRRCA
jgi:hypothetical protein